MSDTAMANATAGSPSPNVDPAIFSSLQAKIDQETAIKDELRNFVDMLSKQGRVTQSILSRVHNTPTEELEASVLVPCADSLSEQATTVKSLAEAASKYPFYKWNNIWQRDIQNVVSSLQLYDWLKSGNLITIEEVGQRLHVLVNVKDEDTFHITIEDYLLALTYTIEELSRLAPNAVTLGDYARPLQISKFVKDVHAGFQLLNLKNDILRRKNDALKYNVKKVEDVVYDLSLRGLIPKKG
ncbi:Translin-1 [Cladophialophora chaetospira]|uniref:Translin-1 n=1 Tax=Cladophialophora chaetospira TaxID=386627 RepID=A0AA38XI67_9EURO|nr:Translin-1 [Cladophialophora chaetospira]